MKQRLNKHLHLKINEGHNQNAHRERKRIIRGGDRNANMWETQHHAKINQSVLPDESHSPCSTATPHKGIVYFPMLITVLFPPFIGTDIKLQNQNNK